VQLQGKWGYLDANREVRIAARFDGADQFVENRARVSLGKRIGYIDPHGALVIEERFDEATAFHGVLARVKAAGKWGFVDPGGSFVIQPTLADSSAGTACNRREAAARTPRLRYEVEEWQSG
jgi:hypothetical protein